MPAASRNRRGRSCFTTCRGGLGIKRNTRSPFRLVSCFPRFFPKGASLSVGATFAEPAGSRPRGWPCLSPHVVAAVRAPTESRSAAGAVNLSIRTDKLAGGQLPNAATHWSKRSELTLVWEEMAGYCQHYKAAGEKRWKPLLPVACVLLPFFSRTVSRITWSQFKPVNEVLHSGCSRFDESGE